MKRALSIFCIACGVLLFPAGASAAVIAGTVTPTAVAPEVEVCVVELHPSENCTDPAANGNYELVGLPLQTPIRVEFIPSYRSHYLTQYFQNVRSLSEATVLRLQYSSSLLEGIDATLEPGGEIEGTVSAPGGGTLGDVEVCVLQAGARVAAGCTTTDGAGDYALGALPTGAYKIGFWGRGSSAEYAPRYLGGKTNLAEGSVVNVTAGGTVAETDETLVKGGKVSGTVSAAASGAALEGTSVCLFAVAAPSPSRCSFTGPGGAYSFVGLVGGSYQVGFSLGAAEIGGEGISGEEDGYLTQYYHGVANRTEAQVLPIAGEQSITGVSAALSMPTILPPPVQIAPPATNIVPPPPTVAVPTKPKATGCKKGFVAKTVKGARKCVKKPAKKKPKKHRKHKHRKTSKHHEVKGK